MPQITGYLTADERSRLAEYARSHGLDAAALASLLLHRELRVGRLRDLRSKGRLPKPTECPEKVTIHRIDDLAKGRFKEHAKSCQLKSSPALALLCRAELQERWLEKAMEKAARPTRSES